MPDSCENLTLKIQRRLAENAKLSGNNPIISGETEIATRMLSNTQLAQKGVKDGKGKQSQKASKRKTNPWTPEAKKAKTKALTPKLSIREQREKAKRDRDRLQRANILEGNKRATELLTADKATQEQRSYVCPVKFKTQEGTAAEALYRQPLPHETSRLVQVSIPRRKSDTRSHNWIVYDDKLGAMVFNKVAFADEFMEKLVQYYEVVWGRSFAIKAFEDLISGIAVFSHCCV
jgi:flagellar biosynthesis GTPase FlhF